MTPIHLTKNSMGIGRVNLIGGRFDGMTKMAVLGAPLCIKVPKPKKKPKAGQGVFLTYTTLSFDSLSTDGEEWKNGKKEEPAKPEPPKESYAIYAPRNEQDAKAMNVYFIEEVIL